MKRIFILLALIFIGCIKEGQTNEEIIEYYKVCIDGGMDYEIRENGFNQRWVYCIKPRTK